MEILCISLISYVQIKNHNYSGVCLIVHIPGRESDFEVYQQVWLMKVINCIYVNIQVSGAKKGYKKMKKNFLCMMKQTVNISNKKVPDQVGVHGSDKDNGIRKP